VPGLEVLAARGFRALAGRRVGLVCNPTAVTRELVHAADLLHAARGVDLVALFGPEHGVRGDAQYMAAVGGEADPRTGLPAHSLYGETVASLRPTPAQLEGLDALVFDVQDVGTRYYTYQATMMLCMEAAAEARLEDSVLALAAAGVEARGQVGDDDPLQAIEDALRTFGADEIILATHPEGRSKWLERGVVERARERFDLPITHVVAYVDRAPS